MQSVIKLWLKVKGRKIFLKQKLFYSLQKMGNLCRAFLLQLQQQNGYFKQAAVLIYTAVLEDIFRRALVAKEKLHMAIFGNIVNIPLTYTDLSSMSL